VQPSFDITGIAGVLVWTTEERHAAMAAFYAETLRLPVRTRRAGFVSFEWPEHRGPRLTIAVHDAVEGQAADPLRIMLNLAVDDIVTAHDHLVAAGVTCRRPPEAESWGGLVATYVDPDGNLVQLFQLP
jgi:predicted enzyme related to lactoylglutathione lyase